MTNFEKYENELIEFFENNGYDSHPAVVNGKLLNCREVLCCNCVMTGDVPEVVGCRIGSYVKWLHQEYTEPPKLTKQEKAFCDYIETGYLVRNPTPVGELIWFYVKPKKVDGMWKSMTMPKTVPLGGVHFQFIKSTDTEPYCIEDMSEWEVEDEA